MQCVVKLYLLGTLVSVLSLFFGLMDSLGRLPAPWGLERCLSGLWTKLGGGCAQGQPKMRQGQAKRRTNTAFDLYL